MPARTKSYVLLLLASAAWGISSPVAKYALYYLPAHLLLTLRFLVIIVILFPIIKIFRPKTIPKLNSQSVFKLIILGLLGTVGQIGLIYWGFTYTTSLDGTLIISTSPIITTLACAFFLKEKITKRELSGLLVAAAGSVVVILTPLLHTGHLFTGSMFGNLLIMAANICWVGYVILDKTILKEKFDPLFLTFATFLVGFISMAFLTVINPNSLTVIKAIPTFPPTVFISILYVALGAGIGGYTLYQLALKTIPASEAEIFNYLIPIFAAPLSFLWLSEPITPTLIISSFLIGLGVYISESHPKSKTHRLLSRSHSR